MLKARVVTALVLVAVLSGLLFAAPADWVFVAFALIAAVAAWEWAGLMRIDRAGRYFFAATLLALCWMAHVREADVFPVLWGAAAVFWVFLAPLWLARKWTLFSNDMLGYLLGALLIVSTWAALVDLYRRGTWILLAVMATVWVADIAAYFCGRAWGVRKLAPSISPGKTWEGALGGAVGVLVWGFAIGPVAGLWGMLSMAQIALVALGLLLFAALSVVGDLFESLLKRQAGLKDSSAVLPGHGGVLDRIDSLTSTLPILAFILHVR
ncbi:MAG: phosphatidate cytidylyltransferase [Rhodocyclaceae bacterium]|jgi:phosphatidate cytidylyltransferase|nr:phosphatidate cytidylyltransferase [Rhodocyclaceae bacterium]